jgi:hypothetical protein
MERGELDTSGETVATVAVTVTLPFVVCHYDLLCMQVQLLPVSEGSSSAEPPPSTCTAKAAAAGAKRNRLGQSKAPGQDRPVVQKRLRFTKQVGR